MGDHLGRIRWACCRRGMLEVDVLLERFLDRGGYDTFTPDEKETFEIFLKEPDPVLYSWLLGHEAPEDLKFQKIITKIQNTST